MSTKKTSTTTSEETSNAGADPAMSEEEIREKMRQMTLETLRTGRIDTRGVKEVGRALTSDFGPAKQRAGDTGEAFSDAIRRLDEGLMNTAASAHTALAQLADKGDDHTDNDLKEALEHLRQLQNAYVETTTLLAEQASDSLQREFRELARHAQKVGADAGARVASLINEFAERVSSTSNEAARSGLDLTRQTGMRMAFLTSGVLAGIADALREQATPKKSE
jgi:ABC-type transporter Mla subunit MlaD